MTLGAAARLLGAYLVVLVAVCAGIHHAVALGAVDGDHVRTAWQRGVRTARAVNRPLAAGEGVTVVDEQVVAEGALVTSIPALYALSFVPGHDGAKATFHGATAYVTPDDLLSHQAYDKGITIPSLSLSIGTDVEFVDALLAEELDTTVPELRAYGALRRVRTVRRSGPPDRPYAATKPDDLTPALLLGAAADIARFVARGVTLGGQVRYLVNAPTNRTLPGYDLPRHAGATFFLAQAAAIAPDPAIRDAALRAARFLRDRAMSRCGDFPCVGTDPIIDVGSTALAVIAMSEVARTGLDPSFRTDVAALAGFLRAQQRPDGEFMHFYDRRTGQRIDQQLLYYSGEITLALARAHALTGDPADLDAARRGLAHLVGPAWSFFGDRYYFGEEHWTCQAMADLWDRAPDPKALDFCARWRAYDARMMYAPGETAFDADGAFGIGPVVTPRLTPVASRTEAGVATLDAMVKAGVDPARRAALASQLRRSYALLLREQLRPGLAYLFADPAAVYGAMPGSEVDWQLRIDYAQHAGSALIRAATVAALLTARGD